MIARFCAPASSLEQSQDQLHLLVEQVREYAIFLLDTSGHVHTWNTGAERIKGDEAAEIVGQHSSVFYTPEDIARGKPAGELARAEAEGHCGDEGWRVCKEERLALLGQRRHHRAAGARRRAARLWQGHARHDPPEARRRAPRR